MRPNPHVYTIVLNYRHVGDTLRCIRSLRQSTYVEQSLLVVDNGADDTPPASSIEQSMVAS